MVARKSNAALRSTTRNKKLENVLGVLREQLVKTGGALARKRDEAAVAVSGTALDIIIVRATILPTINNRHNGNPTAACRKRGNESVDPMQKSTC